MKVSFADNLTRSVLEVIAPKISKARELSFAVAFVSRGGLSLIERALTQFLSNGGKAEFLVGLDFLNTDSEAIRTLSDMKQQGFSVSCYCFWGRRPTDSIYHPKLYLMNDGTEVTAILGSSNLTQGGLRINMEVNAVFEAEPSEELVSDLYGAYNRLKFQQNRFEPDAELVTLYEELQRETTKRAKDTQAATAPLVRRFSSKVATLPRPIPTVANLFGWQKIVYARLPLQVFRTSDMYVYEKEFQEYYPENKHVRDKTRQILQQLRDIGLLRNPHRDRWEII